MLKLTKTQLEGIVKLNGLVHHPMQPFNDYRDLYLDPKTGTNYMFYASYMEAPEEESGYYVQLVSIISVDKVREPFRRAQFEYLQRDRTLSPK